MVMRAARLALVLGAALGCGDRRTPAAEPPNLARLEATVDSLMPRLQVLAGLQKRGEIGMQLQNRDSLRRYIETQMAEELPDTELASIQATYEALGLIPANLDLKALLLELYTEQVAGYYDPATKKLYVVTGADPETLRPTLVHELVHALQDQHTNLDSLIARERGNDRQTAAQAAIEGHATMVMFAFLAEQQTKSPVDLRTLPDISAQVRPAMEAQNDQFPVFQRAPRILRETLLFPYVDGAGFVQKLWLRPLQTGFGDPYPAPLGERLPGSTEQVMHPERFMAERDEPTELQFGPAASPVVRENTLGEFETSILLVEHLGREAGSLARGWDGDRYRLIETAGARVLLWYSVWDSDEAADRFADAYRQIAQKRGRSTRVQRITIDDRPGIEVVDAPAGTDPTRIPLPTVTIAR
ncbi:MAG TPA: hypothetical protein VK864_05415 [Longimicrobiales bacterium]|nr:hypothetical protein [Longimicrobiales bacterium]